MLFNFTLKCFDSNLKQIDREIDRYTQIYIDRQIDRQIDRDRQMCCKLTLHAIISLASGKHKHPRKLHSQLYSLSFPLASVVYFIYLFLVSYCNLSLSFYLSLTQVMPFKLRVLFIYRVSCWIYNPWSKTSHEYGLKFYVII